LDKYRPLIGVVGAWLFFFSLVMMILVVESPTVFMVGFMPVDGMLLFTGLWLMWFSCIWHKDESQYNIFDRFMALHWLKRIRF
jgi:hypothetical protein